MSEPRQRPIPVTSQERAVLEQQKRLYEKATGDSGDWGEFLGKIALLGLAAVGVYALAKATQRSPQSVDVDCGSCGGKFVMALPKGAGGAVYTTCPHCSVELVVPLGTSE